MREESRNHLTDRRATSPLTINMGLENFYTYWAKDGTIQNSLQEAGGHRVKRRSWKKHVLDEARLSGDQRPAALILQDSLELMEDVKQFLLNSDKRPKRGRRSHERSTTMEFS